MSDYRHGRGPGDAGGVDGGELAGLPPADERVTAVLRDAAGDPPYESVDWASMRASIVGDAVGLLARRRGFPRGGWASYVVRWSRAALPGGVAAGLAAAAALAFAPLPSVTADEAVAQAVAQAASVTDEVLFGVVGGSVSRATLADEVTAPIRTAFDADAALGGSR